MGASQQFNKPDFNNAMDADIDAIRDNYHFLMCVAATGSIVLPGWQVTVTATDYSEPDTITLTRGTKKIIINYTWNADSSVNTIQVCYDDGVSSPGLTCFDPINIQYDDDGNVTNASSVSPLDGLVSWWDMDELGTGTRFDSHGSNDMAAFVGTVTGVNDGGIVGASFPGSGALRVETSGSGMDGAGSFSLVGFVNFDILAVSGLANYVCCRADYDTSGTSQVDWELVWNGTSDSLEFGVNVGTTKFRAASLTDPTVGDWHFVYGYYDADNNKIGLQLDDATPVTTDVVGTINTGGSHVKFGRLGYQVGLQHYLFGDLRRFGYYNRVLDTETISFLRAGKSYTDISS